MLPGPFHARLSSLNRPFLSKLRRAAHVPNIALLSLHNPHPVEKLKLHLIQGQELPSLLPPVNAQYVVKPSPEKVNEILKSEGVSGLWRVEISPLEETRSPEDKMRLGLTFEPDETAIERRKLIEGKYVLQTSVPKESLPAEEVDRAYRQLHKVERAWRHIKSYLKIRPVYHRLKRRIRTHVLICFLAFYLVKKMELDLREQGQSRDVEPLLRYWDKLRLTQFEVKVGKHSRREWQWSVGDIGQGIKEDVNPLGWWRSLDAHLRSLLNT